MFLCLFIQTNAAIARAVRVDIRQWKLRPAGGARAQAPLRQLAVLEWSGVSIPSPPSLVVLSTFLHHEELAPTRVNPLAGGGALSSGSLAGAVSNTTTCCCG